MSGTVVIIGGGWAGAAAAASLKKAGAEYFERTKQKNLYTTDVEHVRQCVEACGMTGMYRQKLL